MFDLTEDELTTYFFLGERERERERVVERRWCVAYRNCKGQFAHVLYKAHLQLQAVCRQAHLHYILVYNVKVSKKEVNSDGLLV